MYPVIHVDITFIMTFVEIRRVSDFSKNANLISRGLMASCKMQDQTTPRFVL